MGEGGFTSDEPVLRITIALGRRLGAMQMNYRPDIGLVSARTVQVMIDGQKMPVRQPIDPFYQEPLTAAGLEGGAGYASSVSPLASWSQITMQLALKLPHLDAVIGNHVGMI